MHCSWTSLAFVFLIRWEILMSRYKLLANILQILLTLLANGWHNRKELCGETLSVTGHTVFASQSAWMPSGQCMHFVWIKEGSVVKPKNFIQHDKSEKRKETKLSKLFQLTKSLLLISPCLRKACSHVNKLSRFIEPL